MNLSNSANRNTFSYKVYPWIVCGLCMLFYCYNYFLRVSPSVMQADLMQNFNITASQFGNLAAVYYFAYSAMQIPTGMLFDRFGARIVLFGACLVASLGLAIFIHASNLMDARIGRFLIGLGAAFSYIGVLKLASVWLPPKRFATVAGLTTAFGMASAIVSDFYLTRIVQTLGYKNALYSSLFIGVALSFVMLIFIRSKPRTPLASSADAHEATTFKQLTQSLIAVLSCPQTWLIGIIGCLFYLPASVFSDLWGIPYLENVYNLSPNSAASLISMIFVGWILAGPAIGALSDKIKRRRLPLQICASMAAILLCIVFYVPNLSIPTLYILFLSIGLFCGAHPLCFALGKENNPVSISGTALATINTLIMVGGAIFQPIVGKLLDWHSVETTIANGVTIYSNSDYLYALSVIPLGLFFAIALSFLLKETHCETYEEMQANRKRNTPSNVFQFPLNKRPQTEVNKF